MICCHNYFGKDETFMAEHSGQFPKCIGTAGMTALAWVVLAVIGICGAANGRAKALPLIGRSRFPQ